MSETNQQDSEPPGAPPYEPGQSEHPSQQLGKQQPQHSSSPLGHPAPPSQQSRYSSQQPGYPPQQPGYPPQQPGYPPQQPGYPPQQPDYPAQQPASPPQQHGYPSQQTGYPPQQTGYPTQQLVSAPIPPLYSPQQPSYPSQQPSYLLQQPVYSSQQPGYVYIQKSGQSVKYLSYPPHQPSYPQQGYTQQPGYYPQQGYPGQQAGYAYPPQHGSSRMQQSGYGQQGTSAFQMDPNTSDEGSKGDGVEGFGNSFSNKAIRHAFIRKVYLVLTVQLSFTLAIVALFTFNSRAKLFVRRYPALFYLSFAVFLVTYLTLVCCGDVRRKHPCNIILLTVFTGSFAYMVAMIASFYSTYIVVMAVGLTAGICLLLTLFAVQTKWDFTGCGMFLCVATLVVFLFGLAAMIVAMFTHIPILQLVYAGLIALLFSMYLVYDTQQIVGGRKIEISPEEYIYGALMLYMDIMQIFLAILQLVGVSDG